MNELAFTGFLTAILVLIGAGGACIVHGVARQPRMSNKKFAVTFSVCLGLAIVGFTLQSRIDRDWLIIVLQTVIGFSVGAVVYYFTMIWCTKEPP